MEKIRVVLRCRYGFERFIYITKDEIMNDVIIFPYKNKINNGAFKKVPIPHHIEHAIPEYEEII